MIACRLTQARRVHICATRLLPLSSATVWGQMRGFPWFVGLDPFHSPVRAADGSNRFSAGTPLMLGHSFGPLRLNRIGRILRWREGAGYSFSDLSRRSTHLGFPHVFTYQLCPRGEDACRITITVRGIWTIRWLPRIAVRLWLRWVLVQIQQKVENQLLWFAVARRSTRHANPSVPAA